MIKVLFVCLGNICRSPTADGILRKLIADAGLTQQIFVDSAGTGDWHIGKAPDARTVRAAHTRGYDLSCLRARQVSPADFEEFDFILAMDSVNLRDLQRMKPAHFKGHLGLFLQFSDCETHRDVPDPYYGDQDSFELVLDLVENAAQCLLRELRHHLKRKSDLALA